MLKQLIVFIFLMQFKVAFAQTDLLQKHLESDFYQTQFIGFYLFDPIEKKELYSYNGNKYFEPASNTKIFTLYTAMKTLKDSIPAFKYQIKDDVLHVEGTGDPTFLHPKFKNQRVIDFLKTKGNKIVIHWNNFSEESFLPGWTWDDFRKNYSPERSQFPINENLVSITKSSAGGIKSFPLIFKENIAVKEQNELREFYENKFYIGQRTSSAKVPFIVTEDVVKAAIAEIVNKPVEISKATMPSNAQIFYSVPTDVVYKEMMERSDNFLAEHLLLLTSSTMSGKLSANQAIKYAKINYFNDLKQNPEWIDGSGLSRYNLFTPQNMVEALVKLYRDFPEDRLFNIFPVGGKTGTLKNRFKDTVTPYIYAKTGTLSNISTLSGFIKTRSGKTLIFSLMNNHVMKDLNAVKNENDKLLRLVRDTY